ncbi:hypothetical protein LINGRAHAP2_LOCUS20773 [Linum grandiflorum]
MPSSSSNLSSLVFVDLGTSHQSSLVVDSAQSIIKTTTGKKPPGPKCAHRCEAILKVAGTEKNMGKSFYRCPFWQDKLVDCGFFKWASEKISVEASGLVESSGGFGQQATEYAVYEDLKFIKEKLSMLESRSGLVLMSLCFVVVLLAVLLAQSAV